MKKIFRLAYKTFVVAFCIIIAGKVNGQALSTVAITGVDSGWAGNSINTTIFRKNALTSFKNIQFIAFYNTDGFVMLGKRNVRTATWEIRQTPFKGNIRDAHNSISIITDTDGYLHMAWDQHNNELHYCISKEPLSLEMGEAQPMTGEHENSVSYPEFYRLNNAELLFLYRDGGSGRGNLVVNKYNVRKKKWQQLHQNLIDGEGKRNAYWQACVDHKGTIHISWVWRETPDVASNHDLCYAKSSDGGLTWMNSGNKKYQLPINAHTAEYAVRIPGNSELINQTSMTADLNGRPVIASYWRDAGSAVPQYRVVYKKNNIWVAESLGFRQTAFSLSGVGTKQIPVSRPQILIAGRKQPAAILIFRDMERSNRVSIATKTNIFSAAPWQLADLTDFSTGSWEPSFDSELWRTRQWLHLFVQEVVQADREGVTERPATMVQVLEWRYK